MGKLILFSNKDGFELKIKEWEGIFKCDSNLKNYFDDCCWKKYKAFWYNFSITYESIL